jgi:hypothetical protein
MLISKHQGQFAVESNRIRLAPRSYLLSGCEGLPLPSPSSAGDDACASLRAYGTRVRTKPLAQ